MDLERRIVQAADIVTVALDELLPRADGPESRLTEAMRNAQEREQQAKKKS